MTINKCDKCGEVLADIDAGFSPGLHEMKHDCGGTWRAVKCLEADARGCAAQRGYSDRRVVRVDGQPLTEGELAELESEVSE